MSEDKLKGLLMLGENYIEYHDINITNYSLKEILSKEIGLDKYNYLTGFANLDKNLLKERYNINIENKSLYECICEVPETEYWFLEVLNTFTNFNWAIGEWKDYVAYDENKKRHRFNEDKFNDFIILFKKIYCINGKSIDADSELEFKSDEETKERLERIKNFEKENKNNNKKSNITLTSIINGLIGKGLGYTYFNIYDLKMYQIMSLFYSVEHIENYSFIKDIKANGLWDDKKNSTGNIHWATDNSPI